MLWAMGYLFRMQVGRLQASMHTAHNRADVVSSEHHHGFFELLYMLEGATRLHIRGRRLTAGVGDLLIYYPGEDHQETYLAGRWSAMVLRFPEPRLGQGLSFPPRNLMPPVVRLPWHERFRQLFDQIMLDAKVQDALTDTMAKAYLVQFSVLLRRALKTIGHGGRGKRKAADDHCARIAGAMEMIRDGLDCGLSVRDLARHSMMSESGFSHLFKDLAGVPPRRYAIQARIARARELLETTTLSIKEVAARVGYDDPHYFSRSFRRATGRTPSSVRSRR